MIKQSKKYTNNIMKRIKLIITFIMCFALKLSAQTGITYSDFDGVNTVTYAVYETTLQTVSNPSKTGINTSNNVGKVVSSNNLFEGIYSTNVLSKIDFSQRQVFKLKVYSPRIGYVLFQLKSSTDSSISETSIAYTTKVGEWEELSFDFSGFSSGIYDNITLYFDFYSTVTGESWYFDDLKQVPSLSTTNQVVSLPGVFTDNMVLQQNLQAPVWGFAPPGTSVTVSGSWGSSFVATADSNWKWSGKLQTPTAVPGQAPQYILSIASALNTIVLNNVLIGDVWLCSGQSNMEMSMNPSWIQTLGEKSYQTETPNANYPNIRLFQAPKQGTVVPVTVAGGSWSQCSPATVATFSAVAYYFAKELYNDPNINIPIGIIQSAYEGSVAEAWTRKDILTSDPILASTMFNKPKYGTQSIPSNLYNGMLSPIIPFGIRGATWYQGESNSTDGETYRRLLSAMLKGWRQDWNQGDFPFYFVQLTPYAVNLPEPKYAEFREVQSKFLSETNTAMAVTMDIVDNIYDIHPYNKLDVGKRLSLCAKANTYGQNIVFSGPVFESATKEGSTMRIKYKAGTIGTGLTTKDGNAPAHFTIAGADKVLYPATAVISGNDILVSNSNVTDPKIVRYAFSNAVTTNFMNGNNLPAVPFRTDVPGGLAVITSYASNNTNPVPELADYEASEVNGVNTLNLTAVNAAIDVANPAPTTLAEVQAVVDQAIANLTLTININDFETVAPNTVVRYGSDFSIVANPLVNATNATAKTARLARTSANWYELFAFNVDAIAVPANTTYYLHTLVKYDAATDIAIRYDANNRDTDGATPIRALNPYTTSDAGKWKDLVFAISGGTSGVTVNAIQFHPDLGFNNSPAIQVLNNTSSFGYIDELVISTSSTVRTSVDAPTLASTLANFEGINPVASSFFGANSAVVANPYPNGGNTSANSLKISRTSLNWYELTRLDIPDFTLLPNETKYIHIAVNYPSAPLVNIRVDVDRPANEYGTNPVLPSNTYSGTSNGHWQDLVFAVNGGAKGLAVNNISLVADFNNYVNYTAVGDVLDNTSKFAYFDNIIINNSQTPLFKARTGLEAITLYGGANTNPTPRLVDYTAAGVTGLTVDNLVAVNSAIDTASPAPTTLVEVQAVVNQTLSNLSSLSFGINGFKLYPNPTSDTINIILESIEETNVEIININGQRVLEYTNLTSKEIVLNIKNILTSGFYFVKVTTGNKTQTRKLIVK
jgi:sialate O-acetylesterase